SPPTAYATRHIFVRRCVALRDMQTHARPCRLVPIICESPTKLPTTRSFLLPRKQFGQLSSVVGPTGQYLRSLKNSVVANFVQGVSLRMMRPVIIRLTADAGKTRHSDIVKRGIVAAVVALHARFD